ncbi:MAG TPA: ABC transporter substrate-binding protein, partial [Alteromonas macleodii]|nr:ABC transporter substrate-binding protein [Alteromonas macleodii]
MEIRKGISSVVFVVIVCLCALWSSSTWAQALSCSHAPDLPSTLSPSEKQSIQSYSLTVFKNALSKNGIDLTPATDTISNKADVLINLIRDENNEDSFFWITPLFAFECGNNVRCTPNAGSQATTIAMSYIALSKSEGSAD